MLIVKKLLVFVILLSGCQRLKPEQVSVPEYPDLDTFYLSQAILLGDHSLEKSVTLDAKQETIRFEMDTIKWKKELSFFQEMNPNQPEYVGAFHKREEENTTTLSLKEGEKGILKLLLFTEDEDSYSSITATIHEDKDVYVHHREVEVKLNNGLIQSFVINGYQKMMLKDTVWFGIEGKVLLQE